MNYYSRSELLKAISRCNTRILMLQNLCKNETNPTCKGAWNGEIYAMESKKYRFKESLKLLQVMYN
jgi:hypothetical protein